MIDEMKIDFVWIDWGLKDYRKTRELIKSSTEQKKVEIVKDLILGNVFLLKED